MPAALIFSRRQQCLWIAVCRCIAAVSKAAAKVAQGAAAKMAQREVGQREVAEAQQDVEMVDVTVAADGGTEDFTSTAGEEAEFVYSSDAAGRLCVFVTRTRAKHNDEHLTCSCLF